MDRGTRLLLVLTLFPPPIWVELLNCAGGRAVMWPFGPFGLIDDYYFLLISSGINSKASPDAWIVVNGAPLVYLSWLYLGLAGRTTALVFLFLLVNPGLFSASCLSLFLSL